MDFFEAETDTLCDCTCCFDLEYSACGFAPGQYRVRLWNGEGTVLYGSTSVAVGGAGQVLRIVAAERGHCAGASPVAPHPWGTVKRLFR